MLFFNHNKVLGEYANRAFIFPYYTQKQIKEKEVLAFTCLDTLRYTLNKKQAHRVFTDYFHINYTSEQRKRKLLISFANGANKAINLDILNEYLEKCGLKNISIRKTKSKINKDNFYKVHHPYNRYKYYEEQFEQQPNKKLDVYIIDFKMNIYQNPEHVIDIIRIIRGTVNNSSENNLILLNKNQINSRLTYKL